jgi:hypothetical protein
MSELDTELYSSQTEILGIEQVDFALSEPVFIRLQVINSGTNHKMPNDLIQQIAECIRKYEVNKETK